MPAKDLETNNLRDNFANIMRRERAKAGITQEELAHKMKFKEKVLISRYEDSKISNIPISIYSKFSKALNIPYEDLISELFLNKAQIKKLSPTFQHILDMSDISQLETELNKLDLTIGKKIDLLKKLFQINSLLLSSSHFKILKLLEDLLNEKMLYDLLSKDKKEHDKSSNEMTKIYDEMIHSLTEMKNNLKHSN